MRLFLSLNFLSVVLLPFLLMLSLQSAAQLFPGGNEETEVIEDPLGRSTPRGTVQGFISAVADQDYSLASQYLNLDLMGDTVKREELAQSFQKLLNQGVLIATPMLSDERSGITRDHLPATVDQVGSVTVNNEEIDVLLEAKKGPHGGPIWLFSATTVSQVSNLEKKDISLVDSILPETLVEKFWFGAPIGHWLAALLLLIICYLLAWLITVFLNFIFGQFWSSSLDKSFRVFRAFVWPILICLSGWIFILVTREIGISIVLRQVFDGLVMMVSVVAVVMLLWRLAQLLGDFAQSRMMKLGNASGMSIVLFLKRLSKVTIMILGVILILSIFGVDVTASLAALGIGGIALALGAQTTISNFIGSVTVVADQPIRVGDFCAVGGVMGTVESIGMRSTSIRTLSRTVVTIPNGKFSSESIENYTERDKFLFNPKLNLRYETTPDQLRYLLVELRAILYAHPKVSPDPARVRFTALGSASLDLDIFSYLMVNTFDEYLEVQEDLLLRMMDVVEASGTGFAFPSQTIYLSRDEGLSEDKSHKAEDQVKKWREQKEMQIPKFDSDRIEQLKNSLRYPPEGSVGGKD